MLKGTKLCCGSISTNFVLFFHAHLSKHKFISFFLGNKDPATNGLAKGGTSRGT